MSCLGSELATLAAAAASIAAAVQSKHLLPPEAPEAPAVAAMATAEEQTGAATGEEAAGVHASQAQQLQQGGTSTPLSAAESRVGPSAAVAELGTSEGEGAANASGSAAAAGGAAVNKAQALKQHELPPYRRARRSAADEARRRAFAAGALRRFVAKLEGREGQLAGGGAAAGGGGGAGAGASAGAMAPPALSVAEQVETLVRQATSVDRLAAMYEGWTAWL